MSRGKSIFLLIISAIIIAITAVLCFASFEIPGSTKDYNSIMSLIGKGIDLNGGYYVVLTPKNANDGTESDVESAITILRTRLDNKGYTEANITRQDNNKLRIEIPDVSDDSKVLEIIGSTGTISFRDKAGTVYLSSESNDIQSARVGMDNDGNYIVLLNFTAKGGEKFYQATSTVYASDDKVLYIYLGDDVISSPTVNGPISGGSAQIEGNFSYEEADSLAAVIDSGKLPIEYEVSEQRSISSRLGANAINGSLLAGAIGLAIIFIIMIVYYRGMGIAADIALIIYTLLYVIFLAIVPGVELTLPGIAGILLSIGMAVDANIVIFERIKREYANGKTVKSAVDAGFKRAVITVIDSNVTTILAAIVLFFLASGAIKGFAITLFIGVALSMITSIFVTRWYLKIMLGLSKADAKGENQAKWFNLKKEDAENV
ncbi:MAG: protein translocase subunit SecD [Clostridia bacterium]|nr:protein translocase subunit SecD [Clostridia bacterium]